MAHQAAKQSSGGVPAHHQQFVLMTVAEAAAIVLGRPVNPRTALRWAVAGRNGIRLPTVRGLRGVRCCTPESLHRWLAASSGDEQPAPSNQRRDPVADAGLEALGVR